MLLGCRLLRTCRERTRARHTSETHKHTSGYAIESVRVGAGEGGVHTNVRNTQTNVRFCDRESARARERESPRARGRDVCTHAKARQAVCVSSAVTGAPSQVDSLSLPLSLPHPPFLTRSLTHSLTHSPNSLIWSTAAFCPYMHAL